MRSLEKLYQAPLETAREFAVVVSGAAGEARQKPTPAPQDLTFMQAMPARLSMPSVD